MRSTISVILVILIITSCRKEIIRPEKNIVYTNEIQEAKDFFYSVIKQNQYSRSLPITNQEISNIENNIQVQWDKATQKGKIIYIPLSYKNDLQYNIEGTNRKITFTEATRLIMYKNKSGIYQIEKVITLPDKEYYAKALKKRAFSGFVLVKDWEGNTKRIFQHRDNKYREIDVLSGPYAVKSTKANFNLTMSLNNISSSSSECYTTGSYTSCVGIPPYMVCTDHPGQYVCIGGGGNPWEEDPGRPGNGQPDTEDKPSPDSDGGYLPYVPVEIRDEDLAPCILEILNILLTTAHGSIGDILYDFTGGATYGMNWKVQSGTLSEFENAATNASYDRINNQTVTTFDTEKFKYASDLSIARTILHESIHAYIVAYSYANGATVDKKFPELLRQYEYYSSGNDVQHAYYTISQYQSGISEALRLYGEKKGYNYPESYYSDMSWAGLQGTEAFSKLDPTVQDRILNLLAVEQTGYDLNNDKKDQKGASGGCKD